MNLSSALIAACQTALSGTLRSAFPTRATLFAKSEAQSWALGWHQDRVIAVQEKLGVGGYTNWTQKGGIWHVEPPLEVLQNMIFAQIYFDPVGPDDGPTELAIGSHKFGKIYKDQMPDIMSKSDRHLCLANPGDMLICHSLILHRSLSSRTQNSRRIIRIDFADFDLPVPLRWFHKTVLLTQLD